LFVDGQVAGMQAVPGMCFWQAPAWHLPLVPQVDGSVTGHMPVGSVAPPVTSVQLPAVPAMHDLQAVLQALSQQTPWAQKVLRHSFPAEQEAPSCFSPHELLTQVLGGTHWLSFVQAVKQRVPLQMYGLHASRSGATHWPALLHCDGAL
jgi:hypothetical protein